MAFALCSGYPMTAYTDCYDDYYSIHGAIIYAEKNTYNQEYQVIPDEKGEIVQIS